MYEVINKEEILKPGGDFHRTLRNDLFYESINIILCANPPLSHQRLRYELLHVGYMISLPDLDAVLKEMKRLDWIKDAPLNQFPPSNLS